MGVWVGEFEKSNDAQDNSLPFDTNVFLGSYGANMVLNENWAKNEKTGVKIAWVDVKWEYSKNCYDFKTTTIEQSVIIFTYDLLGKFCKNVP